MKNILVAGGAGFIGSNLCDALINRGDRVVCLDNFLRGSEENLAYALNNPGFRLVRGDATDQSLVTNLLKENDITLVYHLAANSDIQASAKDPEIEFSETLSTTWSILNAMRQTGVKKLFFASTSAVYGEKGGHLLREDDCLAPVSYYGAAKMGSEALLSAFSHMNGMDICVFRFANVIGPRLTHGVIYDFIHKLRQDPTKLEVLGDGSQTKPYIYITDLLRAILMQTEHMAGFEIWNVGVESSTRVSRIADLVLENMGLWDTEIHYGYENIGWKGDINSFGFDLEKILSTGWAPEYSSDEAVRMTIREVLRCRQ